MTVGIAVSGPGAGRAALAALAAIEAVGRGAIGGFVSLAAITADGRLLRAETQRGGAAGMGPIDPEIASAPLVALMSSGPDRPEPLAQFTPAEAGLGLVTGHRLPNMARPGHEAPNVAALDLLRNGESVDRAANVPLAADPEADAGLIVVNLDGQMALANSAAVSRRDDRGQALVSDPATGLTVGVIHNSIFPHAALAILAVSVALDTGTPGDRMDGRARVIGVVCTQGSERALHLDRHGRAQGVTVVDPVWLGPEWEGSVVQRGDPVRQDGVLVGHVTWEVYCTLRNGVVTGGRGSEAVGWRNNGDAG